MKTPIERFYPLIPAGGVGSRLWPLSRATAPKFLLNLTGGEESLLRSTYDRLTSLCNGPVMVVTGVAHANRVTQQLSELRASDLVLEPSPRDSAAAIGLACAIIFERDQDAIIGSFAADHVIEPVAEFHKVVTEAVNTAATGKIVTIGITPTEPSTAFGYIKATESLHLEDAPNAMSVDEFVEKPDADTASQYLATGDYTWNAGMFVAPASLMLEHLKNNEPELYGGVTAIAKAWDTPERDEIMNRLWETLPKTAIDYAVAEPAAVAGAVAMVPGSFSWDDVGDFDAVARLNLEKTDDDLFVLGDEHQVLDQNSTGIVVSGTDRKIAVISMEDVVVVDTPDALLVTTRAQAQKVKNTVAELKDQGFQELL
ncbi:mannose-1-phosphate guanylyltransferase [Rothia terrae]|uniref:mannose-1-phosphate guanylyltransferase n=1 Tax=Rothia terrae TaxID=396015 RepID=UPI0033D3C164